jgi:NDP-sugar pyrophosphorylase family protein
VAILAGGLAVRLRPRTEKIPKVLLEVAGKPFAIHQVEMLRRQGFDDIVFCVGFLGEQVEAMLKDGRTWGVRIRYSFDGPVLLGTGGALRQALNMLGREFLVLYGDSYLECDYSAVLKAFRTSGALGLMTVYKNVDRWDRSNVAFVDGQIRRYDKVARTDDMKHIDYGLGVLRAEAFDKYAADQPLDLMTVYQDLLAADKLAGFEVKERFYEIGSPEGLEDTERYLLGRG